MYFQWDFGMSLEEKFAVDIRNHSVNEPAKYFDEMWFFEVHFSFSLVVHVKSKKAGHAFQCKFS